MGKYSLCTTFIVSIFLVFNKRKVSPIHKDLMKHIFSKLKQISKKINRVVPSNKVGRSEVASRGT